LHAGIIIVRYSCAKRYNKIPFNIQRLGSPKKINSWRSKNLSKCGRKSRNDRRIFEGILWILKNGCPWSCLPAHFGPWKTVYDRFRNWTQTGLLKALLLTVQRPIRDLEYVMVDSTSIRVHQDGARSHDGFMLEALGRSRGGITTKIHMACDALGYPLDFILTGGERGDATQANALLKPCMEHGTFALLDCGYDSDAIRACIVQRGGTAVIPQNPTRTGVLPFDKHLYKERHKIENLFQKIKRFRRIATRYEIRARLFAGMVTLACLCIWLLC
jgi:transposase